jgi:Cys-rich protein (TIGR01571 family)
MQLMAVNNAVDNNPNTGLVACLLATFLCCFGNAINRTAIRKAYNIKGNYFADLMCWCFCPICANVQEYREAMENKYNNSDREPWTMK